MCVCVCVRQARHGRDSRIFRGVNTATWSVPPPSPSSRCTDDSCDRLHCISSASSGQVGLEPHKAVCILGFNSVEWFVADVGAILAGGIAAGIYTTNTAEV